ncbi:MAG: vitamin B12 dependent methionine synthase [Proteobacteria bacterium]|nr:vitamin B12 dependent methionine synthase [Pseudomonadota bacterium]
MIVTLDRIPVRLDPDSVARHMRLRRKDPAMLETIEALIEDVLAAAHPKVMFKTCFVDRLDSDQVVIDGVRFTSRVLAKNLENAERVFPYVATCGVELDALTPPPNDIMKTFILDSLKELVLFQAHAHLDRHLSEHLAVYQKAHMNPGSLSDWPIDQQPVLFSLLGDVEARIGVRLTESHLMTPIKSVAGIYFPTALDFKSCMLCPRHDCPRRQAEFDPDKYKDFMD